MKELRESSPSKAISFQRAPRSFPAFAFATRRRMGRVELVPALRIVGTVAALGLLSVCIQTRVEASPVLVGDSRDSYAIPIAEAAARFNISAAWLRAVMHVESAGIPGAVSPRGAIGLMQIMPHTWTQLRARYHLGSDPFDPRDNIIAGAAYLRELLDRFGTAGFLAAYNAGPKAFEDYLAGLRPLTGETLRYLSRLTQMLPDAGIASSDTARTAPADWRTASLFVSSPSVAPLSDHPPIDHPVTDAAKAHSFALSPQSSGLFVPVDMAAQR